MRTGPPLSVGIDVSKDTLAITFRFPAQEKHFVVPNTPNGITALRRRLGRCSCPLIMESTGRYHILAAFLLAEKGYDVRVVNPIDAKRYISASTRKKKTDQSDAAALAQMGVTSQKLPARFSSSRLDIQIRQKMGLLCSLERQLQSSRRCLKSYQEFQEQMDITMSAAELGLSATVRDMEESRKQLEKEIQTLILNDQGKKQQQELACTIPGISAFLGSILTQLLDRSCASPRQWIAFVGFDIPHPQSGNWRGHGKLSKRGNGYLRKRLFSAGWGAAMNDASFRAYYDRLKADGHGHREAILIITRKLLRILFSVWGAQTPFSPALCRFGA